MLLYSKYTVSTFYSKVWFFIAKPSKSCFWRYLGQNSRNIKVRGVVGRGGVGGRIPFSFPLPSFSFLPPFFSLSLLSPSPFLLSPLFLRSPPPPHFSHPFPPTSLKPCPPSKLGHVFWNLINSQPAIHQTIITFAHDFLLHLRCLLHLRTIFNYICGAYYICDFYYICGCNRRNPLRVCPTNSTLESSSSRRPVHR